MTATGSVEYVLISFPGNEFTGGITPAIAELVVGSRVPARVIGDLLEDAARTAC